MDEKLHSILSIMLIPQILSLIVEKENMEETAALEAFYGSTVYDLLAKDETKLWHYSPLTLYMMWKQEKETGEIIFPED